MRLHTFQSLEQLSDATALPSHDARIPGSNSQIGKSNESLLSHLNVNVKALTFNEISEGHALTLPPIDEIVVHFVLVGSGSIEWDGGCLPLERGTIAIVPKRFENRLTGPGVTRNSMASSDLNTKHEGFAKFTVHDALATDLRIASANINATIASGSGLFDFLLKPVIECPSRRSMVIFESIFEEISRPWLGSSSLIEASMQQILLIVLRNVLRDSEGHSLLNLAMRDHKLAKIVNQIVANPGHRHSLRILARDADLGPAELVRKFQDTFGLKPAEFIQKARIDAAKSILESTRSPIKCIAGAVGFASRSHFSREFTRITGLDPTSFRKRQRSCATGAELLKCRGAV